jgi:hypothetical protein
MRQLWRLITVWASTACYRPLPSICPYQCEWKCISISFRDREETSRFSALILDYFFIVKHGINLLVMMLPTFVGLALGRRRIMGTYKERWSLLIHYIASSEFVRQNAQRRTESGLKGSPFTKYVLTTTARNKTLIKSISPVMYSVSRNIVTCTGGGSRVIAIGAVGNRQPGAGTWFLSEL